MNGGDRPSRGTLLRLTPGAIGTLALGAALGLGAPAAADAQSRLAVLREPDAIAVGLAIVLNSGSPWELDSEAGLAPLAALAAIEQVRPQLQAIGGRARIECHAAATVVTVHLPATTWRLGALLFQDALFDQRISTEAIERGRAELLRMLEAQDPFTAGLREALGRALFGHGHRWARPPCGRPEAVRALTEADVHRIRLSRFRPERAAAAIVGPVSDAEARTILAGFASDDGLPLLVPAPESAEGEGRVHVPSSTVTTWVAIAYPFDRDTDLEALRLLGFYVRESLGPTAARPDVYDVSTAIERHGDGGWLTISLVTLPETASAREDELRALVRATATTPLPDARFDALMRRYRGARMLDLATPEARALDAALDLFFDQRVRTTDSRIDALTPGRLRRAAAALQPPVAASLGPIGSDRAAKP